MNSPLSPSFPLVFFPMNVLIFLLLFPMNSQFSFVFFMKYQFSSSFPMFFYMDSSFSHMVFELSNFPMVFPMNFPYFPMIFPMKPPFPHDFSYEFSQFPHDFSIFFLSQTGFPPRSPFNAAPAWSPCRWWPSPSRSPRARSGPARRCRRFSAASKIGESIYSGFIGKL